MAGLFPYSFYSQPRTDSNFNGGLNSTSGPLSLKDTESASLQNIDFNKFGSILKRNGYEQLNLTPLGSLSYDSSSPVIFNDTVATFNSSFTFNGSTVTGSPCDGLWWYEYFSAGSYASFLLNSTNGRMYSMPGLDGIWSDITDTATITAGNFFSFTNFLNNVYMTNGNDSPLKWTGTGNIAKLPALQANSYTFTVDSITVAPTVGATYTNNSITYTIVGTSLSGTSGSIAGTITATGSGAPNTFGTLTKTGGTGDSTINFSLEVLNANITSAKFVTQWNNYIFLANVTIGTTAYPTRIYWSNLQDDTTWSAVNWIEVSMLDGQKITGVYALADRLIVFKERSIYNMFYTGDVVLPFVVQTSNSPTVGCVAPYSIQEVENGIVFLSFDGFYYYDGNSAYKMSLQIQNTINGLNLTRLSQARSLKQRQKNRYMCSLPSSSTTQNDTVIVWDWVLNAFSVYEGVNSSAMKTVYVGGFEEQIYFADYKGYTYQMDTSSTNDFPVGIPTAINAFYYTNWKTYGDAMLKKATPNVVIYYQSSNAVITFGYAYDFNLSSQYLYTFSLANGTAVYGTAIWDYATYAGAGGLNQRQDLNGRGRVVQFYFANSNMGETFQIDGMGEFVNVETNE
jgi:hypothetical protein